MAQFFRMEPRMIQRLASLIQLEFPFHRHWCHPARLERLSQDKVFVRGFWTAVAERSGDTAFRLRTHRSKAAWRFASRRSPGDFGCGFAALCSWHLCGLSRIPFFNCMDPACSGRPPIFYLLPAPTSSINLGAILSKGRIKSTSPVLIEVSGMLKSCDVGRS